jgi:hypothetical protein
MAVMIGKGKSWLWWLAGFLCAFVFGSRAGAGEEGPKAVALYGIRPGPGGVDAPAVDPEQQKKAEQLVTDYLAPVAAVEPTAEAKATIEKLIKDLGSNDGKVREEASAAVVKHGPAALTQLRAALGSKDLEVAERSKVAVAAIETGARAPKLEEIKKLGFVGQNVVRQKWTEANAAALTAEKAAADAEKAGKADEAEKSKAEAKVQRERAATLSVLLRQAGPGLPGMQAKYGVMIRPM